MIFFSFSWHSRPAFQITAPFFSIHFTITQGTKNALSAFLIAFFWVFYFKKIGKHATYKKIRLKYRKRCQKQNPKKPVKDFKFFIYIFFIFLIKNNEEKIPGNEDHTKSSLQLRI